MILPTGGRWAESWEGPHILSLLPKPERSPLERLLLCCATFWKVLMKALHFVVVRVCWPPFAWEAGEKQRHACGRHLDVWVCSHSRGGVEEGRHVQPSRLLKTTPSPSSRLGSQDLGAGPCWNQVSSWMHPCPMASEWPHGGGTQSVEGSHKCQLPSPFSP